MLFQPFHVFFFVKPSQIYDSFLALSLSVILVPLEEFFDDLGVHQRFERFLCASSSLPKIGFSLPSSFCKLFIIHIIYLNRFNLNFDLPWFTSTHHMSFEHLFTSQLNALCLNFLQQLWFSWTDFTHRPAPNGVFIRLHRPVGGMRAQQRGENHDLILTSG